MTKFILAGGYTKKAEDGGKAFAQELIQGFTSEPTKILVCFFAQREEIWLEKFEDDKKYFSKFISGFELELAREETFLTQCENTDVIYFRGGDTKKLLESIQRYPQWKEHIENKTVVGTSAGGDMLARYSFNLDDLDIVEGIGIVPVKFIPHFKSNYNSPNIDWDKAFNDLKQHGENLEILTLKEGEFKVYYT